MRNSHFYLYGVAIATFGFLTAAPGHAQQTGPGQSGPDSTAPAPSPAPNLSTEQQAQFASWPVEKQTAYELWPQKTQAYYWTLTPERQALFWKLGDDDKITLSMMGSADQDTAWEQIETRVPAAASER